MGKFIENAPSPEILMNSLRSMGYSFESALADVIDNSISANSKNIYLEFPISNKHTPYLSILDDGIGMNKEELFNAMKYGSNRDNYSEKDLGRFGIGLKSASLSQCRCLTVLSKTNDSLNGMQWDLDDVIARRKWDCKELSNDEIQGLPSLNDLRNLKTGTLVIWSDFDTFDLKDPSKAYEALSKRIDNAEQHLRLIYHRFLNSKNKPLKIYINRREITGLDPFLEMSNNPKNDLKRPSSIEIPLDDGTKALIEIQACILPHQNDLTAEDIESLGGSEMISDGQGFYIYRNKRLIVNGTWFRLSPRNMSSELFKYGRIKVDIPNTLDHYWKINIKKQNAVIPSTILSLLKQKVLSICERSKEKTAKRIRLSYDAEPERVWAKERCRDNKDKFFINTQSNFVIDFIKQFDDSTQQKITRFLNVLSTTIPFNDIYYSVCDKKNQTKLTPEEIGEIASQGLIIIQRKMSMEKIDFDQALNSICNSQPYNNEDVINEIKRQKGA